MSVSAGRRTWDEASSPAAVRLAGAYERAWRDAGGPSARPDPRQFLGEAGGSPDVEGAGARLAVLRADLTLRWEAGEKLGARWYLDRHVDLTEDTIVALIYEEFCLREEDGERPDPAAFLERFPEVAPALRRVLDIHGLVGSGSTRSLASIGLSAPGEPARSFPVAGQTIDGFFLVEELGRGSFARVFLARERDLADRPVALKVTRRGSREPQTLARLQHTHIVPVHSHRVDRATGLHLLCMPYFGRTTLARLLAGARESGVRSGPALVEALARLEPPDAAAGPASGRVAMASRSYDRAIAWWGARLAEALEHAHERGVLHRDIKPSNVLVTSDGMPMLLDFNLAREPIGKGGGPDDDTPGGTVDYMAPEHLRALADGDPEGLGHRSDIYSLGVVLYEALTGARPFRSPRRGSSIAEALERAVAERTGPAPRPAAIAPEVPPALDAVVRRCLEPDPDDRYASAADLAEDLRAVADDLPLAHAREPFASRALGWIRRKRLKLAAVAAVLVFVSGALVAWIGFLLMQGRDGRLAEARLDQAEQALAAGKYKEAQLLFETVADLADRIDRLGMGPSSAQGRGPLETARSIVEQLRNLGRTEDPVTIKKLAVEKGILAGRHAQANDDADALQEAAERLRFALLLRLADLPTISVAMRAALKPFYVLDSAPGWTEQEIPFGLLDAKRQETLRDEVDGLLFLWVTAVVQRLEDSDPSPTGPGRGKPAREILAFARDACDRALRFAEAKGPWEALRDRLDRLEHGRSDRIAGPRRPVDIAAERSALACFEWAYLDFIDDPYGPSIAWMRQAVHLKADDYWYQYFLAYLEDLAGHPDEALEHYSTAAALRPDSAYVRFSRARLYRAKGHWDEAFDDFDAALRGLAGRPEIRGVYLERGYLYQTMGDFARARADFDRVARGKTTDRYGRAARLNRADIDADSGAVDRAMAEYDALLAEDPLDSDPVALHSRAILELRRGRASEAERDLSALLGRPDVDARHRVEYLAERAQARLLLGRPAAAVDDAVDAMAMRRSPALERLATRARLAARRYEELRLDRPQEIALLPLRGARLDAELRDAAGALARVADGRGGAAFRAGLTRATLLAAIGRTGEALLVANRTALLSPFSTEARLVRARVLLAAGDRRRAGAEVEWCLRELDRDDPELYDFRAALRLAEGDPDGALKDYDRARSLGSRGPIHAGRATALMALGHDREALEEWSLALQRDPEFPEAYLGRARAYLRLGEWDLAIADLELAAAWAHADPRVEAAVALSYLGCLPRRPGRLPRLMVHLRRAIEGYRHL